MISSEYREMNRALHKLHRGFGNRGDRWSKFVKEYEGRSVLDYGCGKGTLAKSLTFPISEYDPAISGKDTEPVPHDVVVCTDVLEHIEPEHLDATLRHIRSLMAMNGFFVIATRPAKKILPDGRNAHLIVKAWPWWEERLREHFKIVDYKVDAGKDEVMVWVR